MKSFIDINQVSRQSLRSIIEDSKRIKARRKEMTRGALDDTTYLTGRVIGLLFEKPSTRTRVSFDVGIRQMGGQSMVLPAADLQLGNGENISDTAKVLSLYLDMIMIRTFDESLLLELDSFSNIPIINGLTNRSHPCQVMADIMTFEELKGDIKGKKVVWVGDGNNVCTSYVHAAVQFGFQLKIASPIELFPQKALISWATDSGARVDISSNPNEAAKGADLIVTDTHVSMHNDVSNLGPRLALLKDFQVNNELMSKAKNDAIFMHCLPAHRNVEVTDDVIDSSQSAVFNAAENRLHVQKAIMKWCFFGAN